MNNYRIGEDSRLLRELRGLSQAELAGKLRVGIATINRWENGQTEPSTYNLEKLYTFAYQNGIRLNAIKEQFYIEELKPKNVLLFHGAKDEIKGTVRHDMSRNNNDFGTGFYMGESFRQAALFIANFEESSVYCVSFNISGLKKVVFKVDTEWMLTIAYFRGRLNERLSKEFEGRIRKSLSDVDYIVAPIADNRMYQIIDSFIGGEITDEQCKHALAATELGLQYVLKSEKAVKSLELLERCYLCQQEKSDYTTARRTDLKSAEDKVRAARVRYRGKGKYIDELI